MSEDIEKRVKAIIAEQLGVEPEKVCPDSRIMDDLGADSLDTVELVMAFEEEFGFEIPDEEAERMRTVQDIVQYIQQRKGGEG